eukprot:m.442955 g.442955  ORF g.442955 m.442955 type:complete len:78 (+) comp18885_c0_seq1:1047-1280(+)
MMVCRRRRLGGVCGVYAWHLAWHSSLVTPSPIRVGLSEHIAPGVKPLQENGSAVTTGTNAPTIKAAKHLIVRGRQVS